MLNVYEVWYRGVFSEPFCSEFLTMSEAEDEIELLQEQENYEVILIHRQYPLSSLEVC